MHPYLRIRSLTEQEYTQLRKMSISRKLCAGRVKRAQIILLSNQGHLAVEIGEKLGIHGVPVAAGQFPTCSTEGGL
jgi:hypothetical protein